MIALLLAAALGAAQIAGLRADLDAMLANAATLRGAHVGLFAVETQSGRVLYDRASRDAFMPASTFKVLTGSAALVKLGPSFTFKTTIVSIPAEGGVKLVLVGGGDALLRASDLDAAATTIAAANIGQIVEVDADNSYFDRRRYQPGWTVDDLPFYYAPVVTALCLEDNVIHGTITPGDAPGAPATLDLQPNVFIPNENEVTTGKPGSKDTADVERRGDTIVFAGSIPQNAKSEKIDAAVPDPESYALEVFAAALQRHGANLAVGAFGRVLTDPLPSTATVVWRHESAPLATYLRDFWYPSDNLVGEMLLKAIGVARSGVPGTSENGAAFERQWLRSLGVDLRSVAITDGSGLSIYDRISPRALVQILQAGWNGPNRNVVVKSLPPYQPRVVAKTGTRRYARGLAGFVQTKTRGPVTFALLVDDWMGTDDGIIALRARVLSRLSQ